MASITKTSTTDGTHRYRVRWWVEGRRVEKWTTTLAAARALKTQAEKDTLTYRRGARPEGRRASAQRLLLGMGDDSAGEGPATSPSTRLGYARLWRRTIEPSIGRRQLRALRPETVRNWHADVTTTAGRDQAAKAYRLLRAVLATAEADELIRMNPCRIRGGGQEHHEERPLVPTSLVLDLADAIDDRYRALVLVAGFAGLRTGESLGLRRTDVDLLHGEIRVTAQAQEIAGSGRVVLAPKSEAGRRVIAIPAILVDALDAHLSTFTPPDPDLPVFTSPEGGPLRRATLSAAWRSAVRLAGAPDGLRLHDLRHHAATLTARMPGVTTKELMARIGHASPRAALIYQHATAERDRAIAAFLDAEVAATVRSTKAPVADLHGPGQATGGTPEP